MGFERAVFTQRDALLRLLARLLIAVEILSCGPFDGKVTRWVCGVISSVLDRAGLAAEYLVIASARVLAAPVGAVPEGAWAVMAQRSQSSEGNQISCDRLLARIKALKAVLENLPRHALRLLQGLAKRARSVEAQSLIGCAGMMAQGLTDRLLASRNIAARIERPPDKQFALA